VTQKNIERQELTYDSPETKFSRGFSWMIELNAIAGSQNGH